MIVETYSDHILNGIRVAVKQGKLEPQNTGFFYFYKDIKDSYRHKVTCPVLDKNGRLNEWPEGFQEPNRLKKEKPPIQKGAGRSKKA